MTKVVQPRIVVIGEALVDVVHRGSGVIDEAPGGSPANVALTLGRLGRRPALVTSLGDDDRGATVRGWLEESDVAVSAAPSARTSTAVARLDAAGAAQYEFDIRWDLGRDRTGFADLIASADVVHIGSVGAVLAPGADQVRALLGAADGRATITYDPNIRPALVDDPHTLRRRVAELVALADVVKASDEDLRWLHPDRDPLEVAGEWQRRGPALVVVTSGAGGAHAVTATGVVVVPAVPVTVVDTVGAGDTFMGALIDGLADHAAARHPAAVLPLDDLETLLRRCAQAAAITVSRPGADPPRREELAGDAR